MFIRKKYTTHRNIITANPGTRSEFFRENVVDKLVVRRGLVAVGKNLDSNSHSSIEINIWKKPHQ